MKIDTSYLGGSHLYGLNTPESDIDERAIFVNTEPAYILGTKRFDQEVRNNDKEDVHRIEIRKFLELARKGNPQSVELLFAKSTSFTELGPVVRTMRQYTHKLVDSDVLFKVLSSFIHSQKFLIFDDKRKAEEGSKRATKINQFGYNPKAASTSIRLAISGIEFFKTGNYQVEISRDSIAASVKFEPEIWTPDKIRNSVELYDKRLKEAYDNTKVKTVFDEDFANQLLLEVYCEYLPLRELRER